MSDDHTMADDGTPMAAEYVLGTLGAQERRAFEHRLAQEPALRAEVEFWEQNLGGLAAGVAPVDPPAHVLARIEAALDAAKATASGRATIWDSLKFWRIAAFGSAAVAAASLFALAIVGRPSAPGQPLIAKLDASSGQAGFIAALDPARDGLIVVPAVVTNPNQRVLELWIIPPGDRPHSLGLIQPGRPVHIHVPPALMPHFSTAATLAVSLEPPGGSPTGLPTGPVIANGKLTNL